MWANPGEGQPSSRFCQDARIPTSSSILSCERRDEVVQVGGRSCPGVEDQAALGHSDAMPSGYPNAVHRPPVMPRLSPCWLLRKTTPCDWVERPASASDGTVSYRAKATTYGCHRRDGHCMYGSSELQSGRPPSLDGKCRDPEIVQTWDECPFCLSACRPRPRAAMDGNMTFESRLERPEAPKVP